MIFAPVNFKNSSANLARLALATKFGFAKADFDAIQYIKIFWDLIFTNFDSQFVEFRFV